MTAPYTIHNGDCLEVLRGLPDASVDAVVTDPPYGLSFMGKHWDYDVPQVDVWRECLRVLKPGGHLLAFAGTRTQHRMAVNIEDAGFEIRDMIAWVYGSGFPKSLDVSKAIDKAAGAEREVVGTKLGQPGYSLTDGKGGLYGGGFGADGTGEGECHITAPATDAARQWSGWGTALKPAMEPITVARRPLAGTVAENVLAHGTGAINVDGCRVEGAVGATYAKPGNGKGGVTCYAGGWNGNYTGAAVPSVESIRHHAAGRWPANLIHDGSDEVVGLFPIAGGGHWSYKPAKDGGIYKYGLKDMPDGGSDKEMGSAARFFYCAKASKADRDEGCDGLEERDGGHYAQDEWSRQHMGNTPDAKREPRRNHHPTVKPTALMRYLCRLVTQPGGVVLDPFMGSGSTGKAAILEGFRFIGIEREAEYCEIARRRIGAAVESLGLFSAKAVSI